MKTAFIFPGQGAQMVGMGKDLYEKHAQARALFDHSDKILGFSLSRIMFEGPGEELMRTDICQPAIFLHSLALLAVLKKEAPDLKADMAAGLSLGEYSALAYGGAFSFEEGLRLVRCRGKLMQEASDKHPGGLVSLMGTSFEAVEPLCAKSGTVIANLNSPDQVVVAGGKDNLAKITDLAREAGIRRALPLKVAGAFHSPLMDDAAEGLKYELDSVQVQVPFIPIYSNLTGRVHEEPSKIKGSLCEQVNHITRWVDCCRSMLGQGVDRFVEIGPGKVLRGLMKKIARDVEVVSVGDAEGLAAFLTLTGASR